MVLEIALMIAAATGAIAASRFADRKRNWVEADGEVTALVSKKSPDPDAPGPDYFVTYFFPVGSPHHSGEDLAPVEVPYFEGRDAIERAVSRYAPGARIRVFYAPKDPALNGTSRSVLTFPLVSLIIASSIFLALVVYVAVRPKG